MMSHSEYLAAKGAKVAHRIALSITFFIYLDIKKYSKNEADLKFASTWPCSEKML